MPSAHISAYTAHVGRLGVLGSERMLSIRHERRLDDGSAEIANSDVHFSDRFGSGGGFTVADHGSFVRAHLPEGEFDVWLDLLRHEAPVFLHWFCEKQDGPDLDGVLHLSTGPEPPGEGPTDQSPEHRA